jgi:hypothetical protein
MADMELMRMNLRDIVGRKNPLLLAAADQIFGRAGYHFGWHFSRRRANEV